jgi:hypothetical protein
VIEGAVSTTSVLALAVLLAPFGLASGQEGEEEPRRAAPQRSGLIGSGFIGGSEFDYVYASAVDAQGNLLLGGQTYSPDLPATSDAIDFTLGGRSDGFIAKVSPDGRDLLYLTYLGGSMDDRVEDIAVGPSGAVYVVGTTFSADFTTTAGVYDSTLGGPQDGFVAALAPDLRSLLFSTFLGGSDVDNPFTVYPQETTGSGPPGLYVGGRTQSSDFPTTPTANDTTKDGFSDGVVAILDYEGRSLLYSTYLGGGGFDAVRAIVPASNGDPLVTGFTNSSDFPITQDAFDPTFGGGYEGFFGRLDISGPSLRYSTYIGGSLPDEASSLAVSAGGEVVVAGLTRSTDFPVTPGALDSLLNGTSDGFVVALDLAASPPALRHSTYFGGSGADEALDISCSGSDCFSKAILTGMTDSADFTVTPGALDSLHNGRQDGFLVSLDLRAPSLLYSTFIGGAEDDRGASLAAHDPSGKVVVGGYTGSPDLQPCAGAFDRDYGGKGDGFALMIEPIAGIHPEVISTSPADQSKDVSTRANVTVEFSLPMDEVPTAGSISIDPPSSGASVKVTGNTLAYSHEKGFATATTYRVSVSNCARSAGGDLLQRPYEFRFSTAAEHPPLRVISTIPADGATGVDPDAPVVIRFSEPVSLDIQDHISMSPSAGNLSFHHGGSLVQFWHSSLFEPGISYSVTVDAGASSAAGGTLGSPRVFTFSANGPAPPQPAGSDPAAISLAASLVPLALVLAMLALWRSRKKKNEKGEV